MNFTIPREELVRIIEEASIGCADSTRAKLRVVARTTGAVAVGWFHCDGVACPARQARRANQTFQREFDQAMYERFGVSFNNERPLVVTVESESESA